MKQVDDHEEFRRQVGMYFDHQLDSRSREDFLQRVNTDPFCRDCFHREQQIRDGLKKHIYRPGDPTQLIQAIKNQIRKP